MGVNQKEICMGVNQKEICKSKRNIYIFFKTQNVKQKEIYTYMFVKEN